MTFRKPFRIETPVATCGSRAWPDSLLEDGTAQEVLVRRWVRVNSEARISNYGHWRRSGVLKIRVLTI
jgi:hypothetical protein